MSQTQLATTSNQAIDRLVFDDYKLATIRDQICKGGTPAEIDIFIATCEQRGLNPFAKQIYFLKYGGSAAAHVVSIDGLRLIADRTGRYAPGQKASFLYDEKGVLMSATAYVKKRVGNEWIEAEEEAYYEEYVQLKDGRPRDKWRTMPRVMLSKCAEARALRRAFPEELSGLYAQEELDQAGNLYEAELVSSAVPEPPSGRQKVNVQAAAIPKDEVPLTFKNGDHAGKKPDQCPTEFLEASVARWNGGVRARPEMRAEVERVLAVRAGQEGTEAARIALDIEEAAEQDLETAEPILEGDVTELAPIENTSIPEAETVEPPAPVEAPKPKMSNAVKKLIMACERAGLSMEPQFREERLGVCSHFLQEHGHNVELTSFNDLDIPQAFKLQTEIELLKLGWGLAPAETASEEAE